MIMPLRRSMGLLLALGLSPGLFILLQAQTATNSVISSQAGALVDSIQAPPMPVLKSPVDSFRELLAMKADEREKFLADRPAEIRKRLLEKVQEYDAMKPDAREFTLAATQLHWYLDQFLRTSPTNRTAQLASIPEAYRQTVSDRLQQWDRLPPELQKEVLDHKTTSRFFLGQGSDAAKVAPPTPPLPPIPLTQLSRVPPQQRELMYASFRRFFDLPDQGKQKIIGTLPEAERPRMLKTLEALERLPKDQRDRGLQFIGALANMSDAQQQEFFRNAERWKEMPSAERQVWRRMVDRLPPMPPGAGMPPLPMLPMATRTPVRVTAPVATN
ncbi:MAG: hypothetical protein JWR26_3188 [Pedosphaera sp.]|nr:hypothetical protein [Pedosphaera sp.]